VDLTAFARATEPAPIDYNQLDSRDISTNWSSRFIPDNERKNHAVSLSGDGTNEHYAVSFSSRQFGDGANWTYRIGMARMAGSPWLSFSGVFGSIESSTIIDFTAAKQWSSGLFAKVGSMQTSTQIQPGLVQSVSPLWSAYAVGGYQDQQWSVYAGLQPTIFAGHVDMKLPTSVDSAGKMHYTDTRIAVRNPAVTFGGIERRWLHKTHSLTWSAVATEQGQWQAKLTYGARF
jgi:hypothetical protein